MKVASIYDRPVQVFLAIALAIASFAWLWNLSSPLQGLHSVRQADTLFTAWSYCTEGHDFLHPRVAHRGLGTGINIGELPLASEVFSWPCRISGTWSEGAVKWVVLVFFFLNTLMWGLFTKKRWPETWPGWPGFVFLWGFSTYNLLHFTIALPESLALTLLGASLLCAEKKSVFLKILGGVFFTAAFGMRPYLIPLLILARNPRWMFGCFLACGLFYLIWFKWWILQSEFPYYATSLTPFWQVSGAEWIPIAENVATVFIRDLPNFVGLFLIFLSWKNGVDRKFILGTVASVLLVLFLRAPMVQSHHYYLGAAVVFALLFMIQGMKFLKTPRSAWIFTGLFFVIALANVQHLWHGQGFEKLQKVQAALKTIPADDQIAVYIDEGSANTPYLYLAKRTGWSFYASENRGLCPEGAKWRMVEKENTILVEPCSN